MQKMQLHLWPIPPEIPPSGGAALSNSSQIHLKPARSVGSTPKFSSLLICSEPLCEKLVELCLCAHFPNPKLETATETQSLQKMSDAKDVPSLLVIPYSIPFTQTSPDVTMEKIKARLIKDQAQVGVEKGDVVDHDELRESKWIVSLIAPLRNNMGHRQSLLRAPFATVSKELV
jgi:hypothetical protein